jgi:Mn-dependent DtxR family transcriptional regulator
VEDACKMEHVISDVSFEAIKRHAERHLRENN